MRAEHQNERIVVNWRDGNAGGAVDGPLHESYTAPRASVNQPFAALAMAVGYRLAKDRSATYYPVVFHVWPFQALISVRFFSGHRQL
jgi:hypothetical protein